MTTPAVGIDLGTTYSCVGVFQNERVEIIANDQGNRTTPSYVAFNDTERLIGDAAKRQAAMNPTNTVFDAKRLIGRRFSDEEVRDDMKHWPFRIISDGDKPRIQVMYKGEERTFTAEEISSMVLGRMRDTASDFLGSRVEEAVITVPAYFNDAQRKATQNAGTISGLKVLRIINEPTAAAIAYGMDKKDKGEMTVLIFDLGGGTFDVSLLSIDGEIFEVKATSGDTHLGGEDFDNRMVNFFAADFKRKYRKDITGNARAMRRLRTACERAKRALSASQTASIEVDSLYEGIDYYTNITRARFEALCMDLFRATVDPVERVLRDAKISKGEVQEIVLVGGSTRIPKVQELLRNFFNGKEPSRSINPDEAVAYGAAVHAAVLGSNKEQAGATGDILLLDVTPLTLGIETSGTAMTPIVPRGTTVPVSRKETFTTYAENQTTVDIRIFEGERALTKNNNLLGNFQLTGIPPAPRGVPKIEVTYDVSADGILTVTAKDLSGTGAQKQLTINQQENKLSQDDIQRMISEAERFKDDDDRIREAMTARNQLESLCFGIRATLSEGKVPVPDDKKAEIEKLVEETLAWLDSNREASKEEFESRKSAVEAAWNPIMQAAQAQAQAPPGAAPGGMGGMGGMGAPGPAPPTQPSVEELD